MDVTLSVDAIRARYPAPVRLLDALDDTEDGAYCVGGACCFFLGDRNPGHAFPNNDYLAQTLGKLNPALRDAPRDHVRSFADQIIAYNDTGDFAEAWEILRQALAYR